MYAKIYGRKVQHKGEVGWIKKSTNKIQAWNGAQYVQKTLQEH